MKLLKDFNVQGKRVLVRCDFNVPLDDSGNITDDFRIRQSLPTINYLIKNKAKIIIISHLDPESTGVVDKKYGLKKVGERLEKLLGVKLGEDIQFLENLRFNKGEIEPSMEFAKELAEKGDIFINDAFSVCHRNHASIALLPKLLPSGAGLLLEKEIESLNKVLQNPAKPMVAIIGGTKVETKSKLINNISKPADYVIISGLIEKEVQEKNIKFDFPEKIVFPEGDLGALDINTESIKLFEEKILQAKTVLWNGPFGKFEEKEYTKGTLAIARAIIKSKAFSVVGGGETVEFIQKYGLIDEFSHVSTGGGAMMAYLSGEELPGIKALG